MNNLQDLDDFNDDYLWDGSGEPSPELKALESRLGQFRFNPNKTAPQLPVAPQTNYAKFYRIAVAAVVLLGLGLSLSWWQQSSEKLTPINSASNGPDAPVIDNVLLQGNKPASPKTKGRSAQPRPSRPSQWAGLTAAEIKEGKKAKEQLLSALRITSEKLNIVQKRIRDSEQQGPSSKLTTKDAVSLNFGGMSLAIAQTSR